MYYHSASLKMAKQPPPRSVPSNLAITLTWIHSERRNKKPRHQLDAADPAEMNTDVSSSTFRPLVDPRLRFLRPTHRGYTSPNGESTPSLEIQSFETVPLTRGRFFDRCIAVGGCVYTHFTSAIPKRAEGEVRPTVKNPSCFQRMVTGRRTLPGASTNSLR